MEPTSCSICEKTQHIPSSGVWAVATFKESYMLENAMYSLEKSHIIPSNIQIFRKEEIVEINSGKGIFLEKDTLVLELHGIKDIVYLQMLYTESICKENGALTFDTYSKNPFGLSRN